MKNSKVLNNLRGELFQLLKSIPDKSISDRIKLIAMDFGAEFLKWLKSSGAKKQAQQLNLPIVFSTLRFLENIL